MKKSLNILTIMLVAVAMVVVFCGPAAAKVTGRCDGCHTMHNSQAGSPMAKQLNAAHTAFVDDTTANGTLLIKDCVGCHSHNNSITYTIGGCTVPVVYTRGSAPGTYLSGGNFYWVADEGGDVDAKGHNVLGISTKDAKLDIAPGDTNCYGGGCHGTLAEVQTVSPGLGSGCQGCHLNVRHHANDGTGTKYVDSEAKGWYRFLAGHQYGPVGNYGVHGIEHSGWGPSNGTVGGTNHNEYKGLTGEGSGSLSGGAGTMTAFCSGCHGNFHSDQKSGDEWIRHPSDFVIPNSGEYASMSTAYNPNVPVARTHAAITALDGDPSATVAAGADMVMCLSCHRPHGSPFDDLLRWDYGDMTAGGSERTNGCFACHTKKDTGG